jgi:hypothetical protein
MRSKRVVVSLCVAILLGVCGGAMPGCNAGSGEIPLAKVPPPPDDGGKGVNRQKPPRGGSPVNASQFRQ